MKHPNKLQQLLCDVIALGQLKTTPQKLYYQISHVIVDSLKKLGTPAGKNYEADYLALYQDSTVTVARILQLDQGKTEQELRPFFDLMNEMLEVAFRARSHTERVN